MLILLISVYWFTEIALNLEKINHPEDWIKSMALEISKIRGKSYQLMFQASELIPRIKLKGTELSASKWQKQANNLADTFNQFEQPLWFLLDEFPIMIDHIAKKHGVEEARETLHWFRHLRQQNTNSPVRFLITGSIGLDSVLRRHGIRGPANDLRRETLQPLTEIEALELCLKLAHDNHIPLPENLAQNYIQRLGPARWPFFLQLFVAELEDAYHRSGDVAGIDSIYQAVVKNKGNRNAYCENMWDRLKDIFNPDESTTARQLLKRLAVTDNGISQEQLRSQVPQLEDQDFNYVLEVLQHDGYLCETDGRLGFFSHLLRDYWCNRECLV